jgi:hypothetical protein
MTEAIKPKTPADSQHSQPDVPPLPPSARGDARAQEALTRMVNHANTVGQGVHRQFVAPAPKPGETPKEEPPKFEPGWTDKATLKDQISRGPEYWKMDRIEVRIFDLSDQKALDAYNEVLTKANKPDANVVVVQNDRQWNEKSGNWMACVELQHILYRRVLITEKNKDEEASSD